MMTEIEKNACTELTRLTKAKDEWQWRLPEVETYLFEESVKIRAKAIWLYGEMGLCYPEKAKPGIPIIAEMLSSTESLLRERALNALGRIGRADYSLIQPYHSIMIKRAADSEPKVRTAFIWACENIATEAPWVYADLIPIFALLLEDKNERVRIEAPEIFRVIGKRMPNLVIKYRDMLTELSNKDSNRIVRIHAAGAVRAIENGIDINAADE